MFCGKCGNALEDGSNYCERCGTPINVISNNIERSEKLKDEDDEKILFSIKSRFKIKYLCIHFIMFLFILLPIIVIHSIFYCIGVLLLFCLDIICEKKEIESTSYDFYKTKVEYKVKSKIFSNKRQISQIKCEDIIECTLMKCNRYNMFEDIVVMYVKEKLKPEGDAIIIAYSENSKMAFERIKEWIDDAKK